MEPVKKSIRLMEFDFFEILPPELHQQILQYLNVIDLCSASLVNKTWYEQIGKAKSCMEKIVLKINLSNFKIEPIIKSKREYQAIIFLNPSDSELSKIKAYKIVRKFSSSIVSIDINFDLFGF